MRGALWGGHRVHVYPRSEGHRHIQHSFPLCMLVFIVLTADVFASARALYVPLHPVNPHRYIFTFKLCTCNPRSRHVYPLCNPTGVQSS